MRNPLADTTFGLALLFTVSLALPILNPALLPAEEFQVTLRSGTRLVADFNETSIDWRTVSVDGTISSRTIPIADVQSILMVESTSSEEIARVQRYLFSLGDENYAVRQKAETWLTEQGKFFFTIIQQYAESNANSLTLEAQYRLNRVLGSISKKNQIAREFDQLTMADGRVISGELIEKRITGQTMGKSFTIDRRNVLRIARPPEGNPSDLAAAGGAKVQLFHRHDEFFKKNGQVEFRFEADGSKNALIENGTKLDDAYVNQGVKFRNASGGFVGSVSYSFNYPPLPVGGRSACLYKDLSRVGKFIGVMEISFCAPEIPSQPAGVHEVGVFISRVKHQRDIVMEAYNDRGQVVGIVEATDQFCVFAGIKSDQLISKVRIFSNPYLDGVTRQIDQNYAIDTLRISPPQPTESIDSLNEKTVLLKSGERFQYRKLEFTDDQRLTLEVEGLEEQPTQLKIPISDIAQLHLNEKKQNSDQWRAVLTDGSELIIQPGNKIKSPYFNREIKRPDVVAIWSSKDALRFPVASDWDGQAVVVFPTCRIRTSGINIDSGGFSWQPTEKRQQPIATSQKKPNKTEDPTPQSNQFAFSDVSATQKPSFWLQPPSAATAKKDDSGGVIELIDGQRLVLGGSLGLSLEKLSAESVKLAVGNGQSKTIPLSEVRRIQLP